MSLSAVIFLVSALLVTHSSYSQGIGKPEMISTLSSSNSCSCQPCKYLPEGLYLLSEDQAESSAGCGHGGGCLYTEHLSQAKLCLCDSPEELEGWQVTSYTSCNREVCQGERGEDSKQCQASKMDRSLGQPQSLSEEERLLLLELQQSLPQPFPCGAEDTLSEKEEVSTVSGQKCVFPFIFNGATITSCTTVDGDPTPWCSTRTRDNGVHVQGNWGYCQTIVGPTPAPEAIPTGHEIRFSCTTVTGQNCVFPFMFNGQKFSSCTTIDGDPTPWCSTRTDDNGDHVQGNWGYCQPSCSGEVESSPSVVQGSCQCGVKGGHPDDRIVGGRDTQAHEYPWQVGIVCASGLNPFCGGTIISAQHVLTAAHCTDGRSASGVKVLLGEHDISDSSATRVSVAKIIQDPNYDAETTNSDFSILRLVQPVSFSSTVLPACLPRDWSLTYSGRRATVTGWGTLSSGGSQPTVLQEVDVTVTSQQDCSRVYNNSVVSELMLCAMDDGKDSCQGDSGGPLVTSENGRQALIGVVSWGAGCARAGVPGVYARVTERMDWILANTDRTFSSACMPLN